MITRKVIFEEGTTEKEVQEFTNKMNKLNQFLSWGVEGDHYFAIIKFEHEMHELAFLLYMAENRGMGFEDKLKNGEIKAEELMEILKKEFYEE